MSEQPASFLEREHEALLASERVLLDGLIDVAGTVSSEAPHLENARVLRRHLDEPFLLVVVGEVKSGKSSFINTLLGTTVCDVGPTPVTDRIHVLKYGGSPSQEVQEEYLVEHSLPVELLRDLCIVDTPGTNSILRQHAEITERFIPRSDLVLFLTSMDRPYSESENRFLGHISDHWRKKVVFLLSKIDGRPDEDVREVCDYVRRCCLEHHHFEPRVLPISSRQADAGEDGGFGAVRELIRETIASGEKLRLKLDSPLQSALTVIDSLDQLLQSRSRTLEQDHEAIQRLDDQVSQATRDLKERSHQHLTRLYDLLRQCDRRAAGFFDDTLRLRNLGLLRSSDRLKERFQKEVIADLERDFSATMNGAVDWLIKQQIELYERATNYLSEHARPAAEQEYLVAGKGARYEYRREEIFRSIAEHYELQVKALDVPGESRRIMEEAQRALTRQLGLSAVALGVGAGSVWLLAPLWADVTGILVALGMGLAGFAILPAVRRRASRRFSEKMDQLIRELSATYSRTMSDEVDGAHERLREGWEPFLLFHRTESETIRGSRERLQAMRKEAAALTARLRQAGLAGT